MLKSNRAIKVLLIALFTCSLWGVDAHSDDKIPSRVNAEVQKVKNTLEEKGYTVTVERTHMDKDGQPLEKSESLWKITAAKAPAPVTEELPFVDYEVREWVIDEQGKELWKVYKRQRTEGLPEGCTVADLLAMQEIARRLGARPGGPPHPPPIIEVMLFTDGAKEWIKRTTTPQGKPPFTQTGRGYGKEWDKEKEKLLEDVPPDFISLSSLDLPETLEYELAGRANASGHVFDLMVTNSSACPATVTIPLGTVFAPSDTRYQLMMIGETYSLSVKPGEAVTVALFGYCLDPEKLPPAKPADNPGLTWAPLNTAALPESQQQEYAFFATVIQAGNDLSAADRYTTPLPPQESKKTVIQWTIWHVRKPDFYTQATLEEEVTTQFKDAGTDVADPKVQEEIRQGSSQIWASVNLTLKEARTRSTIDISRKASPRDTPLMPTGKNVRIEHSKGLVSVPEEMGATVQEVVAVLKKANYNIGKQNLIWNKDRGEITIDVPAAGNKPAQQYVIDHQGFILSHQVDGKLVSRTSVSRDEKGVPVNVTREDFKTNESEKVYVKVHPRTGQAQALMRRKWKGDEGRKSDETEKEEPYESRWWEKFRDELKKVDLETK